MTDTTTSRRALIKAVPLTAAALAIPASAASPAGDRRRWDEAMTLLEQTKADCEAFDTIWNEVNERWKQTRPTMDSIHWGEFFPERSTTNGRLHVAHYLDLEERWQHFLAGEEKWWWAQDAEARKAEYRAALDSVQAFRDADANHKRDSGKDDADDRSEALANAYSDADTALMNTPAPDLAALRWKLERFRDDDGDLDAWTSKFVAQTYADLARLIPAAG